MTCSVCGKPATGIVKDFHEHRKLFDLETAMKLAPTQVEPCGCYGDTVVHPPTEASTSP
jgi:hypothetical protein